MTVRERESPSARGKIVKLFKVVIRIFYAGKSHTRIHARVR